MVEFMVVVSVLLLVACACWIEVKHSELSPFNHGGAYSNVEITVCSYRFHGLQREFQDDNRPGLIYIVPENHIWLCPFEVDRLQKEYDAKCKQ